MTDIVNIPLENAYSTNISSSITSTATSITVDTAPQFTLPAGQTVDAVIDPENSKRERVKITAISGNTLTISRGEPDYSGDSGTAYSHSGGATFVITDSWSVFNDMATAVNSKIDTANGQLAVYADATARDAAITSPSNGMQCYLTDTGKFYDYTAGSWVERASGGTFANADETTAGKSEEATATETFNGTATGGTGAKLFITPAKLQDSAVSKATSAGVADAGKIVKYDANGNIDGGNIELASNGGLEDDTGVKVKLDPNGGITSGASGLAQSEPTYSVNTGEAIDGSSTPQTVALAGTDVRSYVHQGTFSTSSSLFNMGDIDTEARLGAQFTVPNIPNATITITDIYLYVNKVNTPTDNTYLEIRDESASLPNNLVTNGTSGNIAGGSLYAGQTMTKYTFATPPEVSANTNYWITFRRSGALDASKYYQLQEQATTGGTSATYTQSSGVWTGGTVEYKFVIVYNYSFTNPLYKADADNLLFDYIGFTQSNVAAGSAADVQPDGKLTTSGLTAGKTYYLSTTAGGFTTTPSNAVDTLSVAVGKAMSTTEMKIFSEKQKVTHGDLGYIYLSNISTGGGADMTIPIATGFKPTKIRIFAEFYDTSGNLNLTGEAVYHLDNLVCVYATSLMNTSYQVVTAQSKVLTDASYFGTTDNKISVEEVFDNGFSLKFSIADRSGYFSDVKWIAYS